MSDVTINGITYPEPKRVAFTGPNGEVVTFDLPEEPEPELNGHSKNPPQTRVVHAAIQERVAEEEFLNARIDGIIAPTGEAPSVEEVLDARTGADGTNYASLGAAVRGQVTDLKSNLNDLGETVSDVIKLTSIVTLFAEKNSGDATLPEGFSTGNGYLRNMSISNPGNLIGTDSESNRWFSVQATADMDVFVQYTPGTSRQLGVFDNASYGASNRATPIFASNDDSHPMPTVDNPVHVKAGQYLTFSYYNSTISLDNQAFKVFTVVKGDAALIATTPLTDTMHTQVVEEIHTAMMSGYYHLPVANFARRAWDRGGPVIDNRSYRVRYINPIVFDYDVYAIAQEGFMLAGYADGVFFEATPVRILRKNVEYKIYVRRFTEDGSETADIAEFANALNLATALADINLYKPTFTDVSMFERVGICGDSYAAGGGIISGIRPLTWGKNLERQAGITVDIYAKSGQNVMQWVADSTNGLPALLAGEECGLYWLQHGINGTSSDEQFGSLEDITTYPHPNTFCGQYTEAIEQIKTNFPKARIILATIIGSNFSLYQSTYAKVNNAIRAIAQHCEVMLVDVADDVFYRSYWYSGWGRSNHPTAMQNPGIAMANRRLISKCIQDNPDYFVNYGVRS